MFHVEQFAQNFRTISRQIFFRPAAATRLKIFKPKKSPRDTPEGGFRAGIFISFRSYFMPYHWVYFPKMFFFTQAMAASSPSVLRTRSDFSRSSAVFGWIM